MFMITTTSPLASPPISSLSSIEGWRFLSFREGIVTGLLKEFCEMRIRTGVTAVY